MEGKKLTEVYINEHLKEEQISFWMIDYITNKEGKSEFGIIQYEQPNKISKLLLDFITSDMEDLKYEIFKSFACCTLISEEEQKYLLNSDVSDFKSLPNRINDVYKKYREEFEDYKMQIIDIIQYCIFNTDEELSNLKPLERLAIFYSKENIKKYTILKYNQFDKIVKLNKEIVGKDKKDIIEMFEDRDNNRYGFYEIYQIDNFYKLLFLELYFVLQEITYLKKCKNCGKYFLTNNTAVIYCDNEFEDNKSCREIGASKVFNKNLEKDDAYSLYRKVYKKKQAMSKLKGGEYELDYNMFKYKGKDMKNAYKLNEISKDEFVKWVMKQ